MYLDRNQILRYVAVIEKINPRLTAWEKDFLSNVKGYWSLSPARSAKLIQIYDKATGGGRTQRVF